MDPEPKPKRKKYGGRQKGTPNKATAAREKRIAESGTTALDVMVKSYRYFEERAAEAIEKADNAPSTKRAALRKEADILVKQMSDEASKAAPYIHAKLATLQTSVNLNGRLTLESLLAQTVGKTVSDKE